MASKVYNLVSASAFIRLAEILKQNKVNSITPDQLQEMASLIIDKSKSMDTNAIKR
jgi:hypothetical protein